MNVIPILMQIAAPVKEKKYIRAWKMRWRGREFSPLPWSSLYVASKPSWVTVLLLIENWWGIFDFLSISDVVLWHVCSRAASGGNPTLITVLKFVFYPGNTRIPIHSVNELNSKPFCISFSFTKCCRGIDAQHLCVIWFPFSGWGSGNV